MERMAQRVSVVLAMAGASLRSELQYRANVAASILGGVIYQLTGFLVVWIIVDRFTDLGGWNLSQIAFLYGMRLTSHGIFYATISQMFEIDRVLINGEYDRFLVRPMSPLAQVLTRKLRVNCFGDLIGGIALLTVASRGVDVDWSVPAIGLLLAAVVGGALIEGAVQIAMGSLAFRFLQISMLQATVNEVFNIYGNYPFRIFPNLVQYLLTFALPVAFVAYLPASVILDQTGGLHVSTALAWGAPLIGVALFTLALRIWGRMSRQYQSAGN
jgi:ABC-2 type transport system permease protein